MNPSSPARKTSNGSQKGLVRHKKLSNQPSDPLNKTIGPKKIAVKDIYTSNSSQISSTRDVECEYNGPASGTIAIRRFSQCGVAPGSDEFQSVLKDFIPKPEEIPKESKSQSSKTKCRKISFNEFGRASRVAKRYEDISLSPRPKRSLDMTATPTTAISQTNRALDPRKLDNNSSPAQSRKCLTFQGIREAWYEPESTFETAKRRRHVSLPAPPTGFSLSTLTDLQDKYTLVEPFRAVEKTTRKKSANNSSAVRPGRKISTVVSPNFNMNAPTENFENKERKSSDSKTDCEKNENKIKPSKDTQAHSFVDGKKKQFSSGQDLHPNLLLGIKSKQTGTNNKESHASLEKQFSAEDASGEQSVAIKAHKNFRRIGKAALAARRLLRIHHEENATEKRAISPLAKEDKDFEEMVEVMKTSYQDMRLDDGKTSNLNEELE